MRVDDEVTVADGVTAVLTGHTSLLEVIDGRQPVKKADSSTHAIEDSGMLASR